MSRILKEIFNNDGLYTQFQDCATLIKENLSTRKALFEISNPMDLDQNLEKMHEAKLSIDFMLNLLERLVSDRVFEVKVAKDDIKIEKLKIEINFDIANKQAKEDLTMKDFEKRRDRKVLEKLKEIKTNIFNLEEELDICKLEIKNLERARENIDDIYMSMKKKYDLMIKYNM